MASGGVVGAQGVVELDAGRADAPAVAGAAEQSADGPGVRTGGVGVGVETNGGEVVGRGVVVGEGVDGGEGGLRGVSVAPALGLCWRGRDTLTRAVAEIEYGVEQLFGEAAVPTACNFGVPQLMPSDKCADRHQRRKRRSW